MMEFLIFKDGRDFTESKEEAIGALQKSKKRDSEIHAQILAMPYNKPQSAWRS